MREIKFRAWDAKARKMHPPVDLSAPRLTYKWLGNTDLPLMQYTGLKDKNGVEIYEGDILGGAESRPRVEVYWNQVSAKFQGRPLNKDGTSQLSMGYLATHRRVIGNVCENRESLEKVS